MKGNTMKVQNIESNNGNKIANQFIIIDDDGNKFFQSYNSVIAKIGLSKTWLKDQDFEPKIYLDQKYWNFSNTTSKYRNKFLNETTKETMAKIKSGEYKLVDLNAQ